VARYTLELIEQLARQLFLSPIRLRVQQMEGAEYLVDLIEPHREYPYELVLFHITRYRPSHPAGGEEPLPGDKLLGDLVQLIDELSASANLSLDQLGQACWTIEQVCGRFSISPKTISRWHRRGLVSYRALDADGRRRVVFPDRALRRFIRKNTRLVKRASSFSKLTEEERQTIIVRARELVAQGVGKVSEVADQLAASLGRAAETIRYVVRRYEEQHPDNPIFGCEPKALAPEDQLQIYRCYRSGDTVPDLARRFDRTESTIYRIVTETRARELLARQIEFVYSDEFERPDADQVILTDDHNGPAAKIKPLLGRRISAREDLPVYLKELYDFPLLGDREEFTLFRRYNYLKFKASRLASSIDARRPRSSDLDALEGLFKQADEIKNRLIQANLRLVVSVAKRHVRNREDMFDIISDGNVSLMKAVERFDYTRGFKFSTYASWAIIKNYARTIPEARYQLARYQTGHEERLGIEPDPEDRLAAADRRMEGIREALHQVLQQLPARERSIVTQHYGFTADGGSHTLEQIGELLGVSKERARQLEKRALRKLREIISPSMLEAVLA
jgi:RNA polymerase primary sigma factor